LLRKEDAMNQSVVLTKPTENAAQPVNGLLSV
jgi:hypothetical protein